MGKIEIDDDVSGILFVFVVFDGMFVDSGDFEFYVKVVVF